MTKHQRDSKGLKVLTASAGSGKTHRLTREVLALLLWQGKDGERVMYNRIDSVQAVTFTKKATKEMKERIVRDLYLLTGLSSEKSAHMEDLCHLLGVGEETLRERAKHTLGRLLLDYGKLRVKTIDSFFQEVLRSLAYELDLPHKFRPNLEAEEALSAAVRGVLSDLDGSTPEGKQLMDQLKDLTHELITSGDGHKLTRELSRVAREILKEEVKRLAEAGKLGGREDILALGKACRAQARTCAERLLAVMTEVHTLLRGAGIGQDDLAYKASGGLARFFRLPSECPRSDRERDAFFLGASNTDTTRLMKAIEDPLTAVSKSAHDIRGRMESIYTPLYDALQRYLLTSQRERSRYLEAHAVLDNLNSYAFIIEVERKLHEQQGKQYTYLLGDVTELIHKVLRDEGGANFIYEKLGVRLEHHMIDEFQDTSGMQYENFRPLLEESLASGKTSLVVGDAKQSIYRWRNSDSDLLVHQIAKDFEGWVEEENLSHNWRSTPEIIHFNNDLFARMTLLLHEEMNTVLGAGLTSEVVAEAHARSKRILDYYETVRQEVPPRERRGAVVVHTFVPVQEQDQESEEGEGGGSDERNIIGGMDGEQLVETLRRLQREGWAMGDVAILVRRNVEVERVADLLSRSGIGFTSSEALRLDRSPLVRLLIASLRYIVTPESELALEILRTLLSQVMGMEIGLSAPALTDYCNRLTELGRRGLYESAEGILQYLNPWIHRGELPYAVSFLDEVRKFQRDYRSDVPEFLSLWDGQGSKYHVSSPEDLNKVTIMTIHKSKGLGFPIVLMPLVDWALRRGSQNVSYLWVDNPIEGWAERVPSLPVVSHKDLLSTKLAPDQIREMVSEALDAFNLLYVALTRAQEQLHLYLPEEHTEGKSKEGDLLKSVSKVIQKALREDCPLSDPLPSGWSYADEPAFTEARATEDYPLPPPPERYRQRGLMARGDVGRVPLEASSQRADALELTHLHTYDIGDRLAVLQEGLEHFSAHQQRREGKLLHFIFSLIERVEDVPRAFQQAVYSGRITPADLEAGGYEAKVRDWLRQSPHPEWFDGSGRVLSEQVILRGPSQGSKRPDRIILYPDGSVDVVDYKFGEPHGRYHGQVRGYMWLLRQMGYQKVRGYLWYPLSERVEVVPLRREEN